MQRANTSDHPGGTIEAATKQCADCRRVLPLAEFYDAKGYRGGKHTCCKPCQRARTCASDKKNPLGRLVARIAYRDANLAQLRAYARAKKKERIASMTQEEFAEFKRNRQDQKRIHRAKKYGNGGRHTTAEWELLLETCDHRCVRCGESKPLTRDHIMPLSRGGDDSIGNIQPLCRSCNSSKGNRVAIDYRTGQVVADLAARLAAVRCGHCDSPFRLTSKRRKYCSAKCASAGRACAEKARMFTVSQLCLF